MISLKPHFLVERPMMLAAANTMAAPPHHLYGGGGPGEDPVSKWWAKARGTDALLFRLPGPRIVFQDIGLLDTRTNSSWDVSNIVDTKVIEELLDVRIHDPTDMDCSGLSTMAKSRLAGMLKPQRQHIFDVKEGVGNYSYDANTVLFQLTEIMKPECISRGEPVCAVHTGGLTITPVDRGRVLLPYENVCPDVAERHRTAAKAPSFKRALYMVLGPGREELHVSDKRLKSTVVTDFNDADNNDFYYKDRPYEPYCVHFEVADSEGESEDHVMARLRKRYKSTTASLDMNDDVGRVVYFAMLKVGDIAQGDIRVVEDKTITNRTKSGARESVVNLSIENFHLTPKSKWRFSHELVSHEMLLRDTYLAGAVPFFFPLPAEPVVEPAELETQEQATNDSDHEEGLRNENQRPEKEIAAEAGPLQQDQEPTEAQDLVQPEANTEDVPAPHAGTLQCAPPPEKEKTELLFASRSTRPADHPKTTPAENTKRTRKLTVPNKEEPPENKKAKHDGKTPPPVKSTRTTRQE